MDKIWCKRPCFAIGGSCCGSSSMKPFMMEWKKRGEFLSYSFVASIEFSFCYALL